MARIRSIHPGIFTDADFAFLSDAAQMLYIGILTECDDQGAFKWEPRELKLRLRPGKDGPVEPLLEELKAANKIMGYVEDGQKLGLVRNFCHYQRPKKPNSIYFIPPEFRTYVGLSDPSSEPEEDEEPPVPHQFPTSGENPPQMEDGGWRMEDGIGGGKERKEDSRLSDFDDLHDARAVFDTWNALADHLKLKAAQNFSDVRKKAIRNRLKDLGGLEGWYAALDKVRGSKFLQGRTDNGFQITFDWLLKPANLTKVMEGNYDDRRPANSVQSAIDDLPQGF